MASNRRYLCATSLVILGATAVFTFARARQFDVNQQCVSNAKALATAAMEYAQDYDEKFPPSMAKADFRRYVSPYVGNPAAFICPATLTLYMPNASLAGRGTYESDPCGNVPVVMDSLPHRDHKFTVAFEDLHVERGGKDAEDPNVECVNNVRLQAQGVRMYSQDYDETLPPMNTEDQLQAAIYPYVKSCRAFTCPATRLPYAPNTALSGTLLNGYPDPASVFVVRDPRKHRDGLITTGYLDGHVERK